MNEHWPERFPRLEKFFTMFRWADDMTPAQMGLFEGLDKSLLVGREPTGHQSYVHAHVQETLRTTVKGPAAADRLRTYIRSVGDAYPTLRDSSLTQGAEFLEDSGDPLGAWELMRQSSNVPLAAVVRLSRKADVRLRGDDLLRMVGANRMLTSVGQQHEDDAIRIASGILEDLHVQLGNNIVATTFKAVGTADPTDQQIRELMDECDYLIVEADLRRVAKRSQFYRLYQRGNRDYVDYYADYAIRGKSRWVMRQAENAARKTHGLPEVGGGWVSEGVLFRQLEIAFPNERLVRHARPTWLSPQHLDVYLPERNIAIEFQGDQHVRPIEFFGGAEGFQQQQVRDERKRERCVQSGCELIEVFPDYDLDHVVRSLDALLTPDP